MGIKIDIDKLKEEAEKNMEEAFESWKITAYKIKHFDGCHSTPTTTTDGTVYIPKVSSTAIGTTATFEYVPAPELISMSMVLDYNENLEFKTKTEVKPEPVKPAKPVKRYSKKTFKKKLKELCG